jgi:hypothetical protein
MPSFSSGPFLSGFPTKTFSEFLIFATSATRHAPFTKRPYLNFKRLQISDREQKYGLVYKVRLIQLTNQNKNWIMISFEDVWQRCMSFK